MEYQFEIIFRNNPTTLHIREAIYRDRPLWDIHIDQNRYLVQNINGKWYQSPENAFSDTELVTLGEAIEQLRDQKSFKSTEPGVW